MENRKERLRIVIEEYWRSEQSELPKAKTRERLANFSGFRFSEDAGRSGCVEDLL
ncbi:MAG: hypothetical protein N2V78_02320 [Methanophagales archaeon]|nr:hypothetical protein [Methanophagales archaeon]MCW3142137.1 hypothetical protein [Methanophagales archaeon]